MESNLFYPIKYVALQTGLKPYLIRTWEERHGVVNPKRSSSNRRLYSDQDIQRLKLLKTAVDRGHTISSVAPLSDQDLEALIERSQSGLPSADQALLQDTATPSDTLENVCRHTVQAALSHIRQLDSRSLEKVLDDAAVAVPRQAFLQLIILPLFVRIGELWRDGKLKIVNEHMASTIVRSILWDMLRTIEVSATAPRIVIATPIGHWHEFGALASALAASESGWQAIYFGPNLPSEEIAYAVKKLDARVLTLSLCHRLNDNKLTVELVKIRRLVGKRLPIFIGGPGAVAAQKTIEGIRAEVVNDLSEFRRRIETLIDEAFS